MPEPTADEVAEWDRLAHVPEMVGADKSLPTVDVPDRSPVLIGTRPGRDPTTGQAARSRSYRKGTEFTGVVAPHL